MAHPFIAWTSAYQDQALWLRDLLVVLGFEQPILLGLSGSPRPPLTEVQSHMQAADCVFALVGPGDTSAIADWLHHELSAAIGLQLPVGALVLPSVAMPREMQQAFSWQTIDFSNPNALVAATPRIVELALRIRRLVEGEIPGAPAIFQEIHVINYLSRERWEQVRGVTLTAGLGFSNEIEHSIDCGMDHAGGSSVKLARPEDLKVIVKDRPASRFQLTKNEDSEVSYSVRFEPPLRRGDTVRYRQESIHPNIFPLTSEAVIARAALPGSPPYMKEGLIGDVWEVRRPIARLTMEIEAALDLSLSDPQVRVYVVNSTDELQPERNRIGNPKVAPKAWEVREDRTRDLWTCRVTLSNPAPSCAYALLVRPP